MTDFLSSGKLLWAYDAAAQNAPMRVWNLATNSLVTIFVPGNGNGRGVAFDPTDGNIWTSRLIPGTFNGDGWIHKNRPLDGLEIAAIPDPGGLNGPGIGAMDYDPEDGTLWIAVYQPINGQSFFRQLNPSTGQVLKSISYPFQGGGVGNDTLAIARPGDLGGRKVILSDAGEVLNKLFAIDINTGQLLKTYNLPVGVTGIDVDDSTGELIATDLFNFYNLGIAPYNTIKPLFPTQGLVEDISLKTKLIVPVDIKPGSCPNPLNVKSRGVLPVAILGTDTFDVTQVDITTIELEGVQPKRFSLEDVATPFEPFIGKKEASDCTIDGPDGFLDLVLKFDTQEIVAALGPVTDGEVRVLTLTGNLKPEFGGGSIIGEDVVVILDKTK